MPAHLDHDGHEYRIDGTSVTGGRARTQRLIKALLEPAPGSEWPDADHYNAHRVVGMIGGQVVSEPKEALEHEIF